MAKLMTCAEGEALRSAAGGSFEMAAMEAGLRVQVGAGDMVRVGLIGLDFGDPDVRVEESERGYTVECFTPRASAWLAGLAAKVN